MAKYATLRNRENKLCTQLLFVSFFPAHMLEYHTPHGDEVHSGPQRSLTKCFWSYIEMVLSSSMMPCLCRCVKPYDMKWTFCWSMDKCGIANPIHMRRALCIMTFGWLGVFEAACCILAVFQSLRSESISHHMAFLACFPGSLDLDTRISHGILMHFDAYELPENPWLIRRPPWTLRMFACMHQPSIAWKTMKVCCASYVGFLCFRIYPCNIWDSRAKKEWSFREAINLQDWDSTLVFFPLVIRFSLVVAWIWKFYQWLDIYICLFYTYIYILIYTFVVRR